MDFLLLLASGLMMIGVVIAMLHEPMERISLEAEPPASHQPESLSQTPSLDSTVSVSDTSLNSSLKLGDVWPNDAEESYVLLREQSFEYMGESGRVLDMCRVGTVAHTDNYQNLCLGEQWIVLEWQNVYRSLVSLKKDTLASAESLSNIQFTEGEFTAPTATNKSDVSLLIVMADNNCPAMELCIEMVGSVYKLQFPLGVESPPLDKFNQKTSDELLLMPKFYWNTSGTKAVYEVPCAEGCPPEKYKYFDLQNGIGEVLLSEEDVQMQPEEYVDVFMQWQSDSVLRIGSKLFEK